MNGNIDVNYHLTNTDEPVDVECGVRFPCVNHAEYFVVRLGQTAQGSVTLFLTLDQACEVRSHINHMIAEYYRVYRPEGDDGHRADPSRADQGT